TWEWDGTDWTQASPSTSPVLRDNAAMTYDSARGVTVLFGGFSPIGYRLSDTWEWDGQNWTQRSAANTPPARWGHTMVYDTIVHRVHGGCLDRDENACLRLGVQLFSHGDNHRCTRSQRERHCDGKRERCFAIGQRYQHHRREEASVGTGSRQLRRRRSGRKRR